jgi:hypothetical protein
MSKNTWKVVDEHGNIECPVCKKSQSPNWRDYCVHCCAHEIIDISLITGDHGWDVLDFECRRCGANFITDKEIAESYVLVKKKSLEKI